MFQAAPPQAGQDAALVCMELQKRMQELYPSLERSSGKISAQSAGAAGPAQSGLQQAFVAYSYAFSDNPQVLQQANNGQFNPQQHVDYAKWAQAVQNNPDPRSCYPVPLVGLPALEARINSQQQAFGECTSALEELGKGFGNLKDHLQAQSMQKLEECRRRHQQLSRQLLQVVASLETYAIASGAARICPHSEAVLDDRYARLEEAVHAPASARARVEELWVVLRGLLQREGGTANGGSAARISDEDAQRCLQLTSSQGELLETLQEEVALRKRDVTQFEGALARVAQLPAAPPPF
eukprot:TRINITY_DN32085_c0_g1_i1.p1 TRINITY_DN32085_c0_g1~~TRINITY_DN32085_c0_g1_i1.p1  ORF type:complete len:296 (+),score=93.35 TRINITY_DN32085_c0_g1_i1:78-965(+)